jgi:putative FmdB family regulatory protein
MAVAYAYRCDACGQEFELRLPMGEGLPGKKCPHCASTATRRLLGAMSMSAGAAKPPASPHKPG